MANGIAFGFASKIARHPKSAAKGVLLGVIIGFLISILLGAIIAMVGHYFPFGQVDFWLASLFFSSN
ncbi:MAG: hypothetical protein ACRBBK_05505 [Paracoccaceae bacterium]